MGVPMRPRVGAAIARVVPRHPVSLSYLSCLVVTRDRGVSILGASQNRNDPSDDQPAPVGAVPGALDCSQPGRIAGIANGPDTRLRVAGTNCPAKRSAARSRDVQERQSGALEQAVFPSAETRLAP